MIRIPSAFVKWINVIWRNYIYSLKKRFYPKWLKQMRIVFLWSAQQCTVEPSPCLYWGGNNIGPPLGGHRNHRNHRSCYFMIYILLFLHPLWLSEQATPLAFTTLLTYISIILWIPVDHVLINWHSQLVLV